MSEQIGYVPIMVWAFEEAPNYYKELSTNGGDEDWIAVIPKNKEGDWIPWLDEGRFSSFVDIYDHPFFDGYKVVIGSHA